MSKVIIIGGGIAGLSAGIYARLSGYDAVIYEKNRVAGGNCSSWRRGKYTIDNCIHWMVGTKTGTPQNQIWQELNALGPDVPIVERESFYSSELNGQTVTLWRDPERSMNEMLALSPGDEKEIRRFFDSIKLAESLMIPKEKPWDFKNAFQEVNLTATYSEVTRILFEYGGLTLEAVAARFEHPLLKQLFLDFSVKEYEAYWLVVSYCFFVQGNADVPLGGSRGIVERLVKRFRDLGGQLVLGQPVSRIVLDKKKVTLNRQVFSPKSVNLFKMQNITARNASGILLTDDTFVPADYVICACDLAHTFRNLLKKKYQPASFKRIYKNKKCMVYSSFQLAFAVDGTMDEVHDTLTIECDPIDIGMRSFNRVMIKNYRNYGDYIAPEGQTVIQCMFYLYSSDFQFWRKLKKNYPQYQTAKKNVADAVKYQIEERFPQYEGKLHLLDAWTPCTYRDRNNCYDGAYMRFITTAMNANAFLPTDVKNIHNVFLASHWLRYPGGIPTAATMGKVAISRIDSLEHAKYKMPSVTIPDIELPKVDLSKVDLPKIDLSKVEFPKFGRDRTEASGEAAADRTPGENTAGEVPEINASTKDDAHEKSAD